SDLCCGGRRLLRSHDDLPALGVSSSLNCMLHNSCMAHKYFRARRHCNGWQGTVVSDRGIAGLKNAGLTESSCACIAAGERLVQGSPQWAPNTHRIDGTATASAAG